MLTSTAGHEMYHMIENLSPEYAQSFREFVIDHLKAAGQYENVFKDYERRYEILRYSISRPCCSVFVNNFLGCTPISPMACDPHALLSPPIQVSKLFSDAASRQAHVIEAKRCDQTIRRITFAVMSEPFSHKDMGPGQRHRTPPRLQNQV